MNRTSSAVKSAASVTSLLLPQPHTRLLAVDELDAGGLERGDHFRESIGGDARPSTCLKSLDRRLGKGRRTRQP